MVHLVTFRVSDSGRRSVSMQGVPSAVGDMTRHRQDGITARHVPEQVARFIAVYVAAVPAQRGYLRNTVRQPLVREVVSV